MSEELNAVTGAESFDELYGVDGDGLGEGEVACEAEREHNLWALESRLCRAGALRPNRRA